MGVGQQYRVQLWQALERHSRRRDSGQESAQGILEVRIGEDSSPANLQEQGRVADVCDSHGRRLPPSMTHSRFETLVPGVAPSRLPVPGVLVWRSRARSHC
jgi:hypothetical protein